MKSLFRLLLLAPLLFFVLAAEASAAQPKTGEQLLPKKTLAFAKIPSAAEFRQKWNESSFGAVQHDPAFREFIEDIERQFAQLTFGVEKNLGIGLKELWESLEGELSVGLVHRPGEGFAFVGVADVAGDDKGAAEFVERLTKRFAAAGGIEATLKSGSLDVTSWSVGSGPGARKFSYYRDGGRLVISNSLSTLAEVASRRDASDSETMAGSEAFRQIVKQTAPESGQPALQWYVDPVGLLEAGVTENLKGNPNLATVLGLLPQAGLDKFKAVGGSFALADGGADSVTRTAGYVEQPAGGLLEAFKLPATSQTPPAWVKDDVNLYGQINFNVAQMYRTVAGFVDKTQGPGSFEALVGNTKLGNSAFTYQEFVDQLVGPLHIVAQVSTSAEALATQPTVIAFGVKDAEKMKEMIQELASSAGLKEGAVDGVTMYSTNLPSPIEGQKIELGAAVAEGALMFSTDSGYLKQVLAERKTKRPLADSQAYKQAAAKFPQQTAMINFQRQDQRFEGLYEQIRTGKLTLPLYGGLPMASGLDFSKLPPFSAMSRYMQNSSSYIEPTESGFRIVSIGQPPREQ